MLNQYQPLFLKYRPQALTELVGQEQVLTTLTNAIKHERISHAYLFTGPRGTGKTSSARIFAKSLNCQSGPTASPCHQCTACLEIKQGISPAVFEIDAASNNSVDDARLLIERAPLSACGGRFKLYIIDECHMLTKEAFNALLKTIEEPPANVIFILATTEEHKVPPTIISRCQKLIFRLIKEQVMIEHLSTIAKKENINITAEAVLAISRRANGGLRDALSLLDQVSLLGTDGQPISTRDVLLQTNSLAEDTLVSLSKHIFKREGKEVLALVADLLAEGREAHIIALELAKHLLNVLKAAYSNNQFDQLGQIAGSDQYRNNLLELVKLIGHDELVQIIESVDRLEVTCRRSAQPVMNLEIGLLSLCHRLEINSIKSIQSRLEALEKQSSGKENLEKEITEKESIKRQDLGRQNQKQNAEKQNFEEQRLVEEIKEEKIEIKVQAKEKAVEEAVFEDSPASAVEENEIDKPPVSIEEKNSDNQNIDIVWQDLLVELQKKHLPSFSLVSTHAFPVALAENTLILGVFVENFQKMIENKIDHIKTAAIAIGLDKTLGIRVKVVNDADSQKQAKNAKKTTDEDQAVKNTDKPITAKNKSNEIKAEGEKHDQGAVREAYRLFEGPGSRYISPN